ncbi:MAG TPA: metalloregulator ArsR/SmtB family transcription factor [Candidatus Cloacimonadota bacterium]|nr:metalloregulator ArsR/SmtB family transcription factor [Candidatus Cloacimonadota bacterium]
MTETTKYTAMALIMKAMAHPTRLFILDKLNEKEHCVCELQELIGSDMSTVSRHLSVLRNAGIVDSRKHNNQVYYRLLCPCVLDVYQCMIQLRQEDKGLTK